MRKSFSITILAGALAAIGLCADPNSWQGQLAPGQLLEIRGVRGSVVAKGVPGNVATVTWTKTGKMSDPNGVTVQTDPYSGGVVICAMYPNSTANPKIHANQCNPPGMDVYLSANNNDVEVDFTVNVPQGVLFKAVTNQGNIQATSLTAHAEANTLTGNIAITTTSSAQASTLNGSINAVIRTTFWTGVQTFSAGNGGLDLQIPSDANVEVHASAFRGAIISDFPLNIMPTQNSSMATGTIGKGGRTLRLFIHGGNINLHRGPASGN